MRNLQDDQREIDAVLSLKGARRDTVPIYWGCALAGEVGELCNTLKKEFRGWGKIPKGQIAEELADIVIYCLIIANIIDVDLETEIQQKQESNRRRWDVKA